MLKRWYLFVLLAAFCVGPTVLWAQDNQPGTEGSSEEVAPPGRANNADNEADNNAGNEDQAAIRENVKRYVVAFEKQDAEALAELWSPRAVYVNAETGRRATGREEIARAFAAQFKQAGPGKLRVKLDSIRLVTDDVAIEDGRASVSHADEAATESTYTAVHVKIDGVWLIDSVRETVLPAAPTGAEHLQSLAWLVGEWIDQDEQASVHSVYKWTANQAFLMHTFTVVVEGSISMQGGQVIGWDPVQQRIRSWAFDSEGGFTEGTWTEEDGRWVIHAKSTLADGNQGTAINILTRVDDDRYLWKSTARQVNGEMLPNVDEVEIVRQVEAAGTDQSSDDGAPEATLTN